MFIGINEEVMRFTGRWNLTEKEAVATAPGSMIEAGFQGKAATLHFDTELNMQPFPHLWISVDEGPRVEVPVDRVIRVEAADEGNHCVRIIYKGAVEIQHRWYAPLIGKISFQGLEAEGSAALPADEREPLEFVGDSITEGVLIDAFHQFNANDQFNRPYQDDSTVTYAWLTAEALGMKPVIMGYGAVGVTKSGCGSVPRAALAYPYNFEGSPARCSGAKWIVINHGANDRASSAGAFMEGYRELLDVVREKNPGARIVCVSPFAGSHTQDLKALVREYNEETGAGIEFIDSTGWIPAEPLHPLRDGHMEVARHLTEVLKKIMNGSE